MTGLQTAYYIVALVFMGVMFILIIMLLVAVLVIKGKINAAHALLDEKIAQIKSVTDKANIAVKTARNFVKR